MNCKESAGLRLTAGTRFRSLRLLHPNCPLVGQATSCTRKTLGEIAKGGKIK